MSACCNASFTLRTYKQVHSFVNPNFDYSPQKFANHPYFGFAQMMIRFKVRRFQNPNLNYLPIIQLFWSQKYFFEAQIKYWCF